MTTAVAEKPSRTTDEPMSLPIVGQEIDDALEKERERLLNEAGLTVGPVARFTKPVERKFTKDERDHVTVLIGGLTVRHERFIMAGLQGLGYKVGLLPVPAKADFQAGKEYGNNGQCNPTYFTVGNLVNHLKRLRDEEGLSTEDILDNFLFVTAGACGPCRFGMYEAEYRLALRNSGFDGFRVMLFQQEGGLDQAEVEAGLEFNLNFFLTLLNAIFFGDLLNEIVYQVRPYETEAGATDRVFEKCVERMENTIRSKDYDSIHGGALAGLLSRIAPVENADHAEKFLDQLKGDYYTAALRDCAKMIDEEVEVDFTRPRPVVKITGEFWAQTTEGDGNFNMFPFLEAQGAEVLVETVTTWINYLIAQARSKARDEKGLGRNGNGEDLGRNGNGEGLFKRMAGRVKDEVAFRKQLAKLEVAHLVVNREYDRYRVALGGTAHKQVDQLELQRLGDPYYNRKSSGGEGHLEVAKNIYYCNKKLAHMVLSLKPFGCMPSTQSDGAQAAVVSQYSDMIFLPIETSGEGDVNAHSRVQMALGEAKVKSKAEFKECVEKTGHTIEAIREYVADHRELRRPLQNVPHIDGIVGRAATFVQYVGKLMDADKARA